MTLTDTGPLVGLVDATDPYHDVCAIVFAELPAGPLLTTWPCLVEAMHLLGQRGGYRYQAALWRMYFREELVLHPLTEAETSRMAALMEQYRDLPMDLADASLVAVAESLGLRQVFTVDRQFFVYRLGDGSALSIVP
ncbi:MAG: PIN domain-containing protein [Chloroflexi bacterium]|nr:PIN domain-containing protein [Chloroflexota bacterium]MYD47907.1 PIN domain-containing protein [Chloroflexota bacterium]